MNGNIVNLLDLINSITEEEAAAVAVICKDTALYRAIKGSKVTEVVENERFKNDSLQKRIGALLREMGVPTNLYGYTYLQIAIEAVMNEPDLLHGITKRLYPMIAKKCNTASSRVERAIRHSIEVAWGRGSYALLTKIVPCTDAKSGKTTNSEFIGAVVEYLRAQD